jgi:hypothetical protein
MSRKLLFLAETNDGYSFRNLIEYFKGTNTEGRFVFSSDFITYIKMDGRQTIINSAEIRTADLTSYEYNCDDEEFVVGVNIANMRAVTKSIAKKDGVRLYMFDGDANLYIQILSSHKQNQSSFNIIKTCKTDNQDIKIDDYEEGVKPNCTVPLSHFCRVCSSMTSVKCAYVSSKQIPGGIQFTGMIDGGIVGKVEPFYSSVSSVDSLPTVENKGVIKQSNIPPPQLVFEEDEDEIMISISNIKSLSKLNNLMTNGTIRMYQQKCLPLKLVCNIGSYGSLCIYIAEPPSD